LDDSVSRRGQVEYIYVHLLHVELRANPKYFSRFCFAVFGVTKSVDILLSFKSVVKIGRQMAPFFSLFTLGLVSFNVAFAHPGHNVAEEAAERADFMKRSPKSVRSCASELSSSGHHAAAFARHRKLAIYARSQQGLADDIPMLARRDFAKYDFNHKSNKSVELGSDETALFIDDQVWA
jgi:hypothetical protein